MTKRNSERLCRQCHDFDYVMNRKDGVSLDVLVVCDHDVPETEFFCSTCFYNFDDNEAFWHYDGIRLCPKCHPKDKKPCLTNATGSDLKIVNVDATCRSSKKE